MLITMLNFETFVPPRSVLVVVIEKDNFSRMQCADPITLESSERGGMMPPIKFPENFSMLLAYEEDQPELYRIGATGDSIALLRYLERNRKWEPNKDGVENSSFLYKAKGKG